MSEEELHHHKVNLLGIFNHAMLLANMHIGDQTGLYAALKGKSLTAAELAKKTNCDQRYIEDWLVNQALNGIIIRTGDDGPSGSGTYSLSEIQAQCLATPGGPHDLSGSIEAVTGILNQIDQVVANFKTGEGIPYGKQHCHLRHGVRRFFAPLYQHVLVPVIIPAAGLEEKMKKGIKVADIGCGHGISTISMAKSFPNSKFFGFDYDEDSIKQARNLNECSNASFSTKNAVAVSADEKFDLVTLFDCFHDMNNPEGAVRNFFSLLSDDGGLLLIEPQAGETIGENQNIVGQLYSGFSATCCLQTAKHELSGTALGTLAPTSKLKSLFLQGGFKSFDLVKQLPTNRVFYAKK